MKELLNNKLKRTKSQSKSKRKDKLLNMDEHTNTSKYLTLGDDETTMNGSV